MKIAVGSINPSKLKAVKIVVRKIFPKAQVIAVDVKSGVSNQPKSDDESVRGALNRAKAALKKSGADFAIGMEGGMHKINNDYFECGWVAVIDNKGNIGLGSSARYMLSAKITKKLLSGRELAHVMDELTGEKDTGKKGGAMGILTNNHLPRHIAYSHGVYFAFAPFISDPKFWN